MCVYLLVYVFLMIFPYGSFSFIRFDLVCCYSLMLFYYYSSDACLFFNERERSCVDRRERGKKLGAIVGRGTIIKIYWIKNTLFSITEKNNSFKSQSIFSWREQIFICEWLSVGNSFWVWNGGTCPLLPSVLGSIWHRLMQFLHARPQSLEFVGTLFLL